MVYVVWTGKGVRGKGGAACVKEVAQYFRSQYKDSLISFEAVSNVTGDRDTVHMIGKYESTAKWALWDKKAMKDEKFAEILKKHDFGQLFVGSSLQIYEVLDPA